MKQKILVTGACGFIGSHLVESLAKNKKNKVTALCFYNSTNSIGNMKFIPKKILNKINIIFGDIRGNDLILNIIKNQDIVIHLAALISIPYSYLSPKAYVDTNVKGTLNILEACKVNKVKRLIVTSTSEVYGSAKYVPIDEKHPLNAQSPYAASKIAADQLALSYYRSFDLPVVIARPFNTFGPRQSNRAIIPTLINQMNYNKNSIKVGNISTIRDFTYIYDTVNGFLNLLNAKNINGEIINIASGVEIKISNLIKIIQDIQGIKNLNIIIDKKRIRPNKSEVLRLLGSNLKMKKKSKWRPKFYNQKQFITAIKNTSEWFKENYYLNENVNRYDI